MWNPPCRYQRYSNEPYCIGFVCSTKFLTSVCLPPKEQEPPKQIWFKYDESFIFTTTSKLTRCQTCRDLLWNTSQFLHDFEEDAKNFFFFFILITPHWWYLHYYYNHRNRDRVITKIFSIESYRTWQVFWKRNSSIIIPYIYVFLFEYYLFVSSVKHVEV